MTLREELHQAAAIVRRADYGEITIPSEPLAQLLALATDDPDLDENDPKDAAVIAIARHINDNA